MTELMLWKNREIDQLRKELDRTFRRCCTNFGVPMSLVQTSAPFSMNLTETNEALILTVEMPDLNPEDLDLSVAEDSVTIRGERKVSAVQEGEYFKRFEHRSGSFSHRIPLPRPVEVNEATAAYKDNVLKLVMPKKDLKPLQTISIRVD